MTYKKNRLAAAFGCSLCILILGIVCIVLGTRGYFTFQDPLIGEPKFKVVDIGGGLLDAQAIITLEMITEFNNPNAYDITIKQSEEEGTIVIPACVIKNETASNCASLEDMAIPAESEDDWMVGTWDLPDTILKAKSSTNITVSIIATIDVLSGDPGDLAGLYLSDGGIRLVLRIQGGVRASSWMPGLSGGASFDCLAGYDDVKSWDDIKNSPVPPTVKCNADVMNLISVEGIVIPV
jgi:hypothetical protein